MSIVDLLISLAFVNFTPMKIQKNPDAKESYLLRSAEAALKINFLQRQMVYFSKDSPWFETIFMNGWIEIEDVDVQDIAIFDRAILLAKHLKIKVDSDVDAFVNKDDSSCFLLKKAGKFIQVDRKFHSLRDESESLFLQSNYNLSEPETNSALLINAYHEILNKQEDFIYTFRNNERSLY